MDTTMQILACVYTRISRDQTGERAGVERQLEDCTALAERLNLTVVEHFDDNDISAFSGKHRPGYEAMLTGMKRGEFNAIVCYHPDRLYRSLKDLERLIDTADATGVQIRSVNGGDFDLSNATGKMVARILGSVSRQESEHKAERQRRANQQRRTQGKWVAVGRVPFGYAKEGEPKHYTLVPSEPAASMVRQAAAEVLAGRSLRSLCIEWNGRGISTPRGNPWTNIALTRILTNPVYANMVVDYPQGRAGESRVIGSGTWEPLIDRETHEGLVAFLGDPARNPGSRFVRKHMGSGVYRCGLCGEKLYISGHRGYLMYRCRAMHLSRRGDSLDQYIESLVVSILSETGIRARLIDAPGVDLDELRTRRAALTARADELARMFSAGQIDGSQLGSGTAGLRTQIAEVDQVLAAMAAKSPALALLDGDPDELVNRWEACPPDIKGKIVAELMTVTVLPAPRPLGRKGFDPEFIDITPKR